MREPAIPFHSIVKRRKPGPAGHVCLCLCMSVSLCVCISMSLCMSLPPSSVGLSSPLVVVVIISGNRFGVARHRNTDTAIGPTCAERRPLARATAPVCRTCRPRAPQPFSSARARPLGQFKVPGPARAGKRGNVRFGKEFSRAGLMPRSNRKTCPAANRPRYT